MMTNPYLLTIFAVVGTLLYFTIDAILEHLNALTMSKNCKICGEANANPLATTCSIPCAIEYTRAKKAKTAQKAARKAKKDYYDNHKPTLKKRAQDAINAYIRARDRDLPCISCNRHHTGKYDAGHYRSVGACSAGGSGFLGT